MTQMASGEPSTGANIHVTGRRVLATIVDGIVLGFVFALMSMLFGSRRPGERLTDGLPFVIYLLLVFAYYILMEGYLGQTVGKMLLGIKVVREDNGEVPGLGGAAIRTALRIVDGLFFYLVAFVVVLASGKNQRLGDMVARTLVVRK